MEKQPEVTMKPEHKELLKKYDREYLDDALIGRRLRQLRQSACITRDELAAMTLIPEDELKDYETGQIPLGITRMRQIAAAMDADTMTLLARLIFPVY